MRTLITWTDRGVGPLRYHQPRPGDRGPVLRLLDHQPTYDQVWVLTSDATLPGARDLCEVIGPTARLHRVDLTDPSDHRQLFEGLGPLVEALRGRRVDVLLSAGTPQAQTMWVILVQAGLLDGRMLQVIPPAFVPDPHPDPVREVRLDIEGFPEIRALREQVHRLRAEVRATQTGLVGGSLTRVHRLIARLGPSDVPVWVRGETGTGKELVARALHDVSPRADAPFVAVNAGAFTDTVLHSELFGHSAGAFTGAVRSHRGLFAQADGGTLFLDEVGDLPSRVQVALLRVLETGRVRPVGAEADHPVDVRLISATHRDLRADVEAGRFRRDLYFRLRGAEIEVPPLRDRGADIDVLVHHFLGGRRRLAPAVRERVHRYRWPGNVRELQAEVRRWELLTDDLVTLDDLSAELRAPGGHDTPAPSADRDRRSLGERVRELEQEAIREALADTGGNLSQAARQLGIHRNTLKRKLRRGR